MDADAPPPGWMWAELWTDDPKGSATFYKAVVGYEAWQVGAGAQATWIFASGGRPRARAARMPFEKVPAHWLPYVVVKDLAAALGRVSELNGRVLRKPVAQGPQFAVVTDPGGAAFILEQRPEQPAEEVAKAPAAAGRGRRWRRRRGRAHASASPSRRHRRPLRPRRGPAEVPAGGGGPGGRGPARRGGRTPGRRPRRRGGGGRARSVRQRLDRAPRRGDRSGGRGLGSLRPDGSGSPLVGHAADVGSRLRASSTFPGRGGYYPGYPPASGPVPPRYGLPSPGHPPRAAPVERRGPAPRPLRPTAPRLRRPTAPAPAPSLPLRACASTVPPRTRRAAALGEAP